MRLAAHDFLEFLDFIEDLGTPPSWGWVGGEAAGCEAFGVALEAVELGALDGAVREDA